MRKTITLNGLKDPSEVTPKPFGKTYKWLGEHIVIQMRTGVVYKGKLKDITNNWLSLADVKVIGKRHQATVSELELQVLEGDVHHIHPDTANVSAIKKVGAK